MSDLISRSALLEEIKSQMPQFGGGIIRQIIDVCTDVAVELVKEAPAVDAVPVVHGRWLRILRGNYECSVCRCIPYYASSISTLNYCPNCGAKMDGGNDG